jgi:hypothetical protein
MILKIVSQLFRLEHLTYYTIHAHRACSLQYYLISVHFILIALHDDFHFSLYMRSATLLKLQIFNLIIIRELRVYKNGF